MTNEEIIYDINHLGKEFRGKRQLIDYLKGKLLSRKDAMLAQCYECMGYYSDGGVDCEIYRCPMYPYMPFGTKKPPKTRKGNPQAFTRARELRAKMEAESSQEIEA